MAAFRFPLSFLHSNETQRMLSAPSQQRIPLKFILSFRLFTVYFTNRDTVSENSSSSKTHFSSETQLCPTFTFENEAKYSFKRMFIQNGSPSSWGWESVPSSKTHKPNLFPRASHDAGASRCWLNADLEENMEAFGDHCCKDQRSGKEFFTRTQKVLTKQQGWWVGLHPDSNDVFITR